MVRVRVGRAETARHQRGKLLFIPRMTQLGVAAIVVGDKCRVVRVDDGDPHDCLTGPPARNAGETRRYPNDVPTALGLRRRVRRTGAWAFAVAGDLAYETSRRLAADGSPTLAGDRWVEWSFCLARLADAPGSTLDFGADIGFLSLAAAERGHRVVALDRMPTSPDYHHERVDFIRADILDQPLLGRRFDQVLNCSSIEHVGLPGRYESSNVPDGDLEAMGILGEALAPGGRMILTVPVGRDLVCAPQHRIYGEERLPRLLEGYLVEEEQFWRKDGIPSIWARTDRQTALATTGSAVFYSLGLFVLGRS